MSNEAKLYEEIVMVLSSFQSIFFGIDESTILSELSRKIGTYNETEAHRIIAIYQPTVNELFKAVEKFSGSVSEKAITTANGSLDTERLSVVMAGRFPGADPVWLKRIADQIVYWRYSR